MSTSFDFTEIEHFTAGAVGEPGSRVFYLQVRSEGAVVSFRCEKQQVEALGTYLAEALRDLPAPDPERLPTDLDLVEPVIAEWVVGSMGMAFDERADRLVLIAPADHPLAQRASTRFAEVLDYPFVMLHAGSAIHTFTMNTAAALGRHLEVRIQVRSFEAVCRMVSAGVGLGMVPLSAVSAGAAHAPLVVVELEEPWAQRDLQVCVRKRESLSPFAAELVASLTEGRVGSALGVQS